MSASEIQQLKLPFSPADEVQMLRDSNRHLEIKIEALEEENAMLQRMLFGKKSEKSIRGKIEIEEEEAPPVVPPQTLPSSDTTGKTPSVNKKRRLNATVTKQIEQLVVPKEVMENPFAYERLPESCPVPTWGQALSPWLCTISTASICRFIGS